VTSCSRLPVSVIVPCHDGAATIERALGTVAAQTRPPAEVIVVDDASTDGTAEILEGCKKQRWPFRFEAITLRENRGPGEARNAGWTMADRNASYIAFLDADDLWLPEKLERQIAWMECRPDIAWTAHRCRVAGDVGILQGGESDASTTSLTSRGLLGRNSVATPTVVIRHGVSSRFRTGWRHCEDLMLWLDLLDDGARGEMLGLSLAALGRVPGTPGGSTGDLAAMYRGEVRVIHTLAAEERLRGFEAAAWRGYAWLRYLRRRSRA
jgi:glycosyltransferase involved in cell wall biosynthesis